MTAPKRICASLATVHQCQGKWECVPFEIAPDSHQYILATPEALAASPEVAALIAESRREAEAMTDGLVKASAWVSVAAEVLAGYNRDLGVDLPDTTEIGRIDESRDTPSFRITVGHIRILAAAIRALKEETP